MLQRVILAYLLVPLVVPLWMLISSGAWRLRSGDWFGILLLYEVIGLAAVILLGTPLLLIYRWRRWTGWIPFMVGGGLCAAITAGIFLFHTEGNRASVIFFTALGMVSGAVFRFVLYGSKPSPS